MIVNLRRAAGLLLLALLLAAAVGPTRAHAQDNRTFPETGFRIADDQIWEYFNARGGVDTFGFPASNTFRFRGFPVQIFQRHVIQVVGDEARPMNLLDPALMPVTRLNGSTFPAYDEAVAEEAPAPDTANYGDAVQRHLAATVPNEWEGEPVGFRDYYLSAAPSQNTLVALEVWGFPTSEPRRDPSNNNFIYQRFQRGIMHYDASTGVTRGILLGDAFKNLLRGENLPADFAREMESSPFLGLYDPDAESGLARTETSISPPVTRDNTNLANAFTPGAGTTPGTPQSVNRVSLQTVAEGLTAPIYLTPAPDDSGRLFVVDQAGLIRVIGADGRLRGEPFLDVRDRMVSLNSDYDERGLLGMAFHPNYAENGRFYVYYSAPLREGAPDNWNHTSHLSEFRVSDDANRADPGSERVLLRVDEPQSNHNGGMLLFGPDDYLYVGLGDGGAANDTGVGHPPLGNGQDRTTLLGSILRLDVDGSDPYEVPDDNPFVGQAGADEIYAYGFRNPWRFSFDGASGDLYVADVGQNRYEEVSRVQRGGNYGWNIREATHCFDPSAPDSDPASCASSGPNGQPLRAPILEYGHGTRTDVSGLAVVGGHRYRGGAIPGLQGQYVFGDWSQNFREPRGQLLAATPSESGLWPVRTLSVANTNNGQLNQFVLGFGEDEANELYVLVSQTTGPTGSTGRVLKLAPAP